MIYTLGCSFTKWYWPTWADWLGAYLRQPIQNLAYPGHTNKRIYYQLLDIVDKIMPEDLIYIAWGTNHKVSHWYDKDWIIQNDVMGFFPKNQGKLWHSNESYQGLWKCHPGYQPSITEMIMSNWDIILKTQLLLNVTKCNYQMMFCQNPWMDTREQHTPVYQPGWDCKGHISKTEVVRAQSLIKISPLQQTLNFIDWTKFIEPPTDKFNPSTYFDIWNFMLSKKEYVVLNHNTDQHPNTLVHHDWAVKIAGVSPTLKNLACDIANRAQSMTIPEWSAEDCVIGATQSLNRWALV